MQWRASRASGMSTAWVLPETEGTPDVGARPVSREVIWTPGLMWQVGASGSGVTLWTVQTPSAGKVPEARWTSFVAVSEALKTPVAKRRLWVSEI